MKVKTILKRMKRDISITSIAGAELLGSQTVFAADYNTVLNNMTRVATGISVAMSLFGFLVVGIAHSSHAASRWAQERESGAIKGAAYSMGATAIFSIFKAIFG
jgi:hypothetical protein